MENTVDILLFGGQSNMQGQTESVPEYNPPVENALEYRFLSNSLPHLPPSLVSRLIRKKHFRVNGKHVPADYRLAQGDILAMYLSDEQLTPPPPDEEWRLVSPEVSIAYDEVTFNWVKGHATNPKNNRCDELAVAESKKFSV